MGFYAKYWSTLLKGPGATRFKIRSEIRKIENFSNQASHLLFHEFPRLIEKEHRVTKFLKVLVKFVTTVKKTGENCFKVLFNESTQDMRELKEVEGILQEIGEFWKKMPMNKLFKKIELDFLLQIINVLKNDEIKEREEYKLVAVIINESINSKNNHERFMAEVRKRFKEMDVKKLAKIFERIVWRKEARISKQEISATHSVKKQLWNLLDKITKEKNETKLKQLAQQLESKLNEMKMHIANMFKQSYLVKERAILMVLRIIYIADYANVYLKLREERKLVPAEPTEKGLLSLEEAIRHLGADFNKTIAQEFRIIIHDIEKLEKDALILVRQQ